MFIPGKYKTSLNHRPVLFFLEDVYIIITFYMDRVEIKLMFSPDILLYHNIL